MSGEERHQVTLQSDDEMKIKGKKGRKKRKKHVEQKKEEKDLQSDGEESGKGEGRDIKAWEGKGREGAEGTTGDKGRQAGWEKPTEKFGKTG